YIIEQTKAEFHLENTDLAIISNDLTMNSDSSFTKKRNLKYADLQIICHWVLNAWKDISEGIIDKKNSNENLNNNEFDDNSEEEMSNNNKELIFDDNKKMMSDNNKEVSDKDNNKKKFDKDNKPNNND
ncbi:20079_t:CDS:2, partial [Cetraspora pellucida]